MGSLAECVVNDSKLLLSTRALDGLLAPVTLNGKESQDIEVAVDRVQMFALRNAIQPPRHPNQLREGELSP